MSKFVEIIAADGTVSLYDLTHVYRISLRVPDTVNFHFENGDILMMQREEATPYLKEIVGAPVFSTPNGLHIQKS